MVIIYLSRPLRNGIHLPTLHPEGTGVPCLNEPLSTDGIRGISACKVYPLPQLLTGAVSSYLTFSPLSGTFIPDGNFLWHSLFPFYRDPAIHRCIALCCPDFPPLPCGRSDNPVCSGAKVRNVGVVDLTAKAQGRKEARRVWKGLNR